MQWLSDPLHDRLHEARTVTKFLFFPKYCDNRWRWLERATWVEHVMPVDVGGSGMAIYKHKWRITSWVN